MALSSLNNKEKQKELLISLKKFPCCTLNVDRIAKKEGQFAPSGYPGEMLSICQDVHFLSRSLELKKRSAIVKHSYFERAKLCDILAISLGESEVIE